METIYLRFPDRLTAVTLAIQSGLSNSESEFPFYNHTHAIDEVGTIYNNDGIYDEEGNIIQSPTPKPGYHFNIRLFNGGQLPENLIPYQVFPNPTLREFF